jgi:hypothetical protein
VRSHTPSTGRLPGLADRNHLSNSAMRDRVTQLLGVHNQHFTGKDGRSWGDDAFVGEQHRHPAVGEVRQIGCGGLALGAIQCGIGDVRGFEVQLCEEVRRGRATYAVALSRSELQ